ncbi:MAG: protein kinase [Planctomycetes bacterium]|nr:protein kinase [Planctomycetota bacterium]MCB9918762.1 protein kinase [Planctomycetota bacterium]
MAEEPPEPGNAEGWILAYLDLRDRGEAPPLRVFLESVPPELRDEVERDCRRLQDLEVELRQGPRPGAAGPSVSTEERAFEVDGYRLDTVVDEGGMGRVWRGERLADGMPVAIKVLKPRFLDSFEARERFRREAEIGHEIAHEGLVPVLEHGEREGCPYLVMPFIGGGSLSARIDQARMSGTEAFEASEVAQIAIAVLHALESCHDKGIIHRDLKPANILLDEQGNPRLIDFGLARVEERSQLTRVGTLVGTVAYMSPEQTLLALRHPIDARTDVYSLGAVLYAMLTLHPPFGREGDDPTKDDSDILRDILFTDPNPPSRIDARIHRDLETICLKALEKAPPHRYQSAREMRLDLERFLRHEAIVARPVRQVVRWMRRLARNRVAIGVVIGLSTALVALAAWAMFHDPRPRLHVRAPEGTRVWLARFDFAASRHDRPRELGAGPLATVAIDPGYYRITVERSETEFAERDEVVRSEDVTVDAPRILALGDVTAGMVRFEDDRPFIAGIEPQVSRCADYDRREYPALPPFAIDRFEVSFREYRAYLAATGAAPPKYLTDGKPPELDDYPDDYPAVGLSHAIATAYAAWAGKRLPTRLEWERAARGTDGRRYLVPPPFENQNVVVYRERTTVFRVQDVPGWASGFLRNAVPTTFDNADVTPEGVHHLMGNASEFIAGFDRQRSGEVLWNQAIIKGGDWHDSADAAHFDYVGAFPRDYADGAIRRGFRCAKSLLPPSRRSAK